MTDQQHTNLAFVADENKTLSTTLQKNGGKGDSLSVDLRDMKKPIESDYDPYKMREVEHPTTNSETLLHLLKGSLGTGILAMPNAFYHSGYILGLVGTIVIGMICIYCVHLLIKAEYELCKRRKTPSMSYPATIKAAFSDGPSGFKKVAPYSGHVVDGFLLVYQLGTCCVYMVFIASNVKAVLDMYVTKIDIAYYLLIFLVPLIFMNWIRNLKLLAPFSTVANAITFVSFGIIVYYLISDGPTFENREPIGKLEHLPLFFGTVLFALEAIGVIMPLENEMKTPQHFGGNCGVLNIGMGTIVGMYVGMGLLGYLTYGDKAEGTITLNISDEEILAQVVKITLAIAIFITYALQCYVAVDIAWNNYLGPKLEKHPRKLLLEYVTRTVLVIITFLLAVAVPKLDLFISLFGALCLAALGIAIPAIIDLSTHWYDYTGFRFKVMFVQNVFLVIFGILGLIIGTYMSLSNIIAEFTHKK